jgi:DDE superfamily endonuclease
MEKLSVYAQAPKHKDALAAGFRFDPSGTKTYWANQATMRLFVDEILAPYFDDMKAKLDHPEDQMSLWMIDMWAVHRSEEFLDWMLNNHPTIFIDFVPAGCTGVAQPCDVGIQHVFKHIMNQCFMEDVVGMALAQLDKGEAISLDEWLPTLCNASVRWLWTAYQILNKKSYKRSAR